jgi:hypothetical protein
MPDADWVAVMVVVPTLNIFIVLPDIVATLVFELVYVKPPLLFELGGDISKLLSPIVFGRMTKFPSDGLLLLLITSKDDVITPELKLDVSD